MKYLEDSFNNIFVKAKKNPRTNEAYKSHDGNIFEEMISKLLECIYPELTWFPTNITNDGNKDFWTHDDGRTIWAECKNYKDPIALKVIAPTLVMAQLCNANEIYFFSVSPINDNAKKKICYYSQINDKKVHFIDDVVLENLLLANTKTREYFAHISGLPSESEIKQTEEAPTIYKLTMKNPYLNVLENDILFGSSIKEIEHNDIVSVNIFIINNNISNKLKAHLKIDNINENIYCFEYLEKNAIPSFIDAISDEIILEPNEVFTKVYNFRVKSYRPKLRLPDIQVCFSNEAKKREKGIKPQIVECHRIGKTQLIGFDYENILLRLDKAMNSSKRLIAFWCRGKSGVGKTRILEESTSILLKHHYKILNFTGIAQENSLAIIKEVIYVLYNINEEILEPLFTNYDDQADETVDLPPNIHPAIKLLRSLQQHDLDVRWFVKKYGELIFEKLLAQKYVIIIDNIQYYDEEMCEFLESLIMYVKNTNRHHSVALLITINEDYIAHNKPAKRVLNLLEKLENNDVYETVPVYIEGMDKGSALLYIKQLLNICEETFDDYLCRLVCKVNYNPYYIKYFAEHIMHTKFIVSYSSNDIIIKNHHDFLEIIDAFPERLKLSIHERWETMVSFILSKGKKKLQGKTVERRLLYILSCLHIFRNLTHEELSMLGCYKTYIGLLEDYHFIRSVRVNGMEKYLFDHDLIEDYFENFSTDCLYSSIRTLQKKELIDFSTDYSMACSLIRLNRNDLTPDETMELIYNGINNEISYKLFLKYEQLSARMLIRCWNQYKDQTVCIDAALGICTKVRERFGGNYALPFFRKFYTFLEKRSVEMNVNISNFSEILFAICEAFHHNAEYRKVIGIYQKYLSEYERLYKTYPNEKLSEIVAFMYNRLSIAYNHFLDYKSVIFRDACIENAIDYSVSLSNKQYFAEALYDKASFYYYRRCDKARFLCDCEKSCKIVDDNQIELMTLHNIQRKIRICLVKGERSEIPKLVQNGLDYIETGEFTEYRFFFSKFFHTAMAMYYMLEKTEYNAAAKELHISINETHSFGSDNIAYNQFLMGKIYYHKQEYEKSLEEYKAAYLYIRDSNIGEKDFVLEILADDLFAKIKYYPKDAISFFRKKDKVMLNKILNMTDEEYATYQKKYQAKSIIHSDNDKENYPSI